MNILARTTLFAILVIAVNANTEKAIFLAPKPIRGFEPITLGDHQEVEKLTPSDSSLRKSLPVAFPTETQPYGVESWYLLSSLQQEQRYEVRVCWAAIQPTTFWVDVFDLKDVYTILNLHQDIVDSRQHQQQSIEGGEPQVTSSSDLFLRIRSAADFFTTNHTLMQTPPPVAVDIILDPYIGNVFPRSLIPTAAYIVILAIGSWFVSGILWTALKSTTLTGEKDHSD